MDVVQLLELIQTLMDVVLSSTSILLHFAYIHSYNCIYGVPLFRTLPPCILHVEAWPAAIHNPELSDVSCPLVCHHAIRNRSISSAEYICTDK